MKFKETTYGEFNKRFSGLARLACKREEKNLTFGGSLLNMMTYRVNMVYNSRKDCTYYAITCIGYIDIFGPNDDTYTLVARMDGKLEDTSEFPDEELRAMCEECLKRWREKYGKSNKEES